jgi:hypothetical protein
LRDGNGLQGLILVDLHGFAAKGARRDVLGSEGDERDEEQGEPGSDPDDDLSGRRAASPAHGQDSGEPTPDPLDSEDEEHASPSSPGPISRPLDPTFARHASRGKNLAKGNGAVCQL